MSESIRRKPVSSAGAIAYSQFSSPYAAGDPVSPIDTSSLASAQHIQVNHLHDETNDRDNINTSTNAPHPSEFPTLDFNSLRSLELRDPSVQVPSRESTGRPKHVKWGVHWLQPTYVLLCTLVGIALALGHHFYYASLSGSPAGSPSRQQWTITFGSSFAYLVVHVLGAAMVVAYSQYIWSIIRQRVYTIETLDHLFSMASDPSGLLNWEILRHGRAAALISMAIWGMGFASVTPPATLVVVAGWDNTTTPTPWLSLNWSLPGWIDDQTSLFPINSVIDVGTLATYEAKIASIPPPASNSSYHLNFSGPALQCNAPNATQQRVFDYYRQSIKNQSLIYTPNIWEQEFLAATWRYNLVGDLFTSFLAFSAFAPAEIHWYGTDSLAKTQNLGQSNTSAFIDQFKNWYVNLPPVFDNLTIFGNSTSANITSQQFWVLTASESIVCILGNASYDVDFEYTDGQQAVSQSTRDFEPLFMPREGKSLSDFAIFEELVGYPISKPVQDFIPQSTFSYMSVFTAFTSTLSGNVTLAFFDNQTTLALNATDSTYSLSVAEETSHVLTTGLGSCQDLVPTTWFNTLNLTKQGLNFSDPAADRTFNKPPSMCRNKTLEAALEDLFQKITISMLAANISGSTNKTIDVNYFPTRNIYQYNKRNLIISYSIAVTAAVACISIGLSATISNGVNHSTSFSAVISTAQNPNFKHLFEGNSLGALPLDREIRKVKLKFGELMDNDGTMGLGKGDNSRHIGFGFEDDVLNLRKNGNYT